MVDHTHLMQLAVEIGYRLQESGAEIYRVEEAVSRVFQAYGVEDGQAFAIPNCLFVSATDNDGKPISSLRRIRAPGNDITRMERVYGFCRQVCQNTPDVTQALEQLRELDKETAPIPLWAQLLGYFVGAGGFALFFGGNLQDALAGGLCGVSIGLCLRYLGRLNVNLFLRTVIAAFVSVFLAAVLVQVGIGVHTSFITIGALMALVPGIMFTTFMQAILVGDLVSGLFKLVEALLTGGAIALGAFLAMAASAGLWGA